jgi:hypothetical protein
MPAFSRSIASTRNNFEQRSRSRTLSRQSSRDTTPAEPCQPLESFLAKTLGCLCVSLAPGYQELRPLNRSNLEGCGR